MRIAKAIFAITVFVGGALTSTGIVEVFGASQTAMPMVALITVSGVRRVLARWNRLAVNRYPRAFGKDRRISTRSGYAPEHAEFILRWHK